MSIQSLVNVSMNHEVANHITMTSLVPQAPKTTPVTPVNKHAPVNQGAGTAIPIPRVVISRVADFFEATARVKEGGIPLGPSFASTIHSMFRVEVVIVVIWLPYIVCLE